MDNKFKVGDVVKCIEADEFTEVYGLCKGKTYTISLVDDFGYVGLAEFKHTKTEWLAIRFELVEQKEKEMTFKNMKFDVAAIAKQLNVEHEEASRIIQEALFEQGYVWNTGGQVIEELSHEQIQCWKDGRMTRSNSDWDGCDFTFAKIKPTYTIVEAEEQQEIVELNGKKYNKQELEKALSFLNPIE